MKFTATILLTLALIVSIVMASCTKSYTCHCNIVYSGAPGLPDSSSQEYQITNSKSGAKSACSGQSGTYDNNGIHTVETCYLY